MKYFIIWVNWGQPSRVRRMGYCIGCHIIQIIMNCQLSQLSTQYFDKIIEKTQQMHEQINQIDRFGRERQKKYEDGLKAYSKYLKRENQALKNNAKHTQIRNKWYAQQVKKTWSNVVSRRPLILRTLARTNVVKRDADEWLARMDDSLLERSPRVEREESLEGSRLMNKYNDILNQYNMKARN